MVIEIEPKSQKEIKTVINNSLHYAKSIKVPYEDELFKKLKKNYNIKKENDKILISKRINDNQDLLILLPSLMFLLLMIFIDDLY